MKSRMIFVTAGCGLLVGFPAQAQAQPRPGFEIGAQAFDYKYRERSEGETIAKDDGQFVGFTGSYVETIGARWFLRARASTGNGKVDYSSEDGTIDDVSQQMAQVELNAGHSFAVDGGVTLTPFVGLGGRVLEDNSGGEETEAGVPGYDREVIYAYIPAGLEARLPIGGATALTLAGQYNWVIRGSAKSELSEVDAEAPDVDLELNGGSGLEASAMLSLAMGRNAISFGPFVRQWNIKRSESAFFNYREFEVEVVEPPNKTREMGLRVAFAF